ncbi:MAG: hypothetical protein K6F32_00005, partial [Bacilli bacterium]|nr:hypothetical protein [Bacilli bacterium]
LIHELGTFAEVGSGLVNDGLFSAMGTDGMQWALILGTSMLPNALNNILSTDLVQTALPVAMELALNLDDVKSVLGEDTVKWLSDNSVDWNAQLGNVASLYRKLLDADIFDMVLPDTYSQSPIFDLRQLYKVFSSDESQTAFHDAMSIADNAVVNHLLAGLMYTMSTKEDQAKDDDPSTIQLVDFLPHDESGAPKYDEMAELSWFSELTIVFDTVHEMVGIDAEQSKGIFDELPSNAGAETKSKRIDASSESSSGSGIFSEAVTGKLTNFIFDHAGDLIDCLIGARDANGEPTGVDAKTGISTGDSKNFLDSALIYNALPSLVPFLQETMNKADLQVDLANAQTALMDTSSSCLRVNFKREFGAMLDFVGNLTATDAGKAFLKNLDSLAGIEFDPDGKLHSIDPDLVSTLKDALKEIDESEILGLAVPQISERMVTNAVDLSSYGLNKLDFYCDNFGEELGKLLSLAVDCKHVLRDFVGASDSFSIDAVVELAVQEKDEFIVLLEALAGSAILNPVDKDDGVANKNFCNLLNTVFSKISSDIEQFTPDKLEGVPLVSTRNEAGEITAHGECSLIVEVLFDLASSGVVNDLPNLSGASASEAIKVIQKLDIHDLFSDIGASKVFSTIGGSLLDGFLSKIIGASELGLGEKVTFKNVKTQEQWTNEANALQAIVDLAANGLDLSNFDFFKDGAQFGPLLKALAKSNMFMYGDEYCFPQYLYNKMLASVDSSTLQYFADDGVTSDQLSAATTLEQKKALCLNLYADMVTGLPNQSDWAPDTGVGEIDRINAFLLDVSRMGGIDALTSFSADKLNGLRNALVDVASSEAFGRTILMNGLNKGISSINAGDEFDFTAANTSYFAGDGIDAAKRVAEVNTLMDAFEVIYDPSYGIANGTSFDSSKLNLANLSVDFFLRPALEGFSESQVLSTVKEGSTKTSVHKQIICLMLRKAGLYTVTEDDVAVNPGYSEKTIRQIVDGVTDWDATTDDLCDAVSALQSSALVKDGELNFNAVSDPAKYFGPDSISREEKAAELRLIFGKMNSCELTYRALPERLYSALQTVDDIIDGDFDGGFIKAANPYFMAQGTDLARYPDEEIDRVVQCFADISRVQNMNPNDISTINPVTLTDLLDHMSYTGLFNSPKEAGKLTAFQELLVKVVGIDQLGEYLYYAASPKDIANKTAGNYDDYEKKASYIVKTVANARYDASAAELSAQSALLKGESASLRSLLALFVSDEMKSLLAGGTMTFQDLSPNSLARMLSELNDNAFFYDCVPNILAKLGADSATFNIAGVDLTLGNYFFAYYYNADGSTKGSPDYSAHYTDDEIYNVASLFNLIKKTQSTLGGSFNLKDIDMVSLKHLLLDLNNSVVFHNESRRDPCLDAEAVAYSGDDLTFNDLTVFEQIIYLIYDKAQISNLTYDVNTDLSLYLEYGAKGYQMKKHNEIVNYDQDEWLDQINNLADLVTTIQTSSLVDSSGNITMDVDSLKALPPSELMAILDA